MTVLDAARDSDVWACLAAASDQVNQILTDVYIKQVQRSKPGTLNPV
jgi:hypothetical protein